MFIIKSGKRLLNACFKIVVLSALGFSTLTAEDFVLTVSEERAQVIEEIVTTMGDTNVVMLKFKEKHLRELSQKLRGMGSFNFLGYIFTHPELKEKMPSIGDSSWKFNGFMGSVRKGFDRDRAAGTLWDQIPGFARLVDVDEARLKKFVQQSEWDDLVRYLIKHVR